MEYVILDIALRLIVIGQLVLISLVLIARGPKSISIPQILLNASVAAFLIKSSPQLSAATQMFQAPILVLCWAAPYFVWYCANALFDFERPRVWVMVLFPTATVALCGYNLANVDAPTVISVLSILTSLTVVLHAVYAVLSGSLDDLSERRRRFRLCFVICITVVAVIILMLELLYVGQKNPPWLPVAIAGIIAAAVLLVGVPLLNRPNDLLPERPPPQKPDHQLDLAERETHNSLIKAMENRAYARTGLTIRQLAEELKLAEHHLRMLINKKLGYKNFSTFLNGYRIEETCKRLADPKEARVSVLTIALDAGFASLAPFNRAFRQSTGMTPSDYRREKLRPVDVVTPIRR